MALTMNYCTGKDSCVLTIQSTKYTAVATTVADLLVAMAVIAVVFAEFIASLKLILIVNIMVAIALCLHCLFSACCSK